MEAQFDRNERRRFAAEARAYDRLGRQFRDADLLIGELISGRFYINIRSRAGALTGRVRYFDKRSDARDYLIRNRYV